MTLKLCNHSLKTNKSFSLKYPLKKLEGYWTASCSLFKYWSMFLCSANCEATRFWTPLVPNYKLICKYFSYKYGKFVFNRKSGITTISPSGSVTFLPSSPLNCELFNNTSTLIIISCWQFNDTFSGSLNLLINKKGTALIRKLWKGVYLRLWLNLGVSSLFLVCLSYFFQT